MKLVAEVMVWKVLEGILAMSLASELGQDSITGVGLLNFSLLNRHCPRYI